MVNFFFIIFGNKDLQATYKNNLATYNNTYVACLAYITVCQWYFSDFIYPS